MEENHEAWNNIWDIIKYLISIILPIFTGWLGWYLKGYSEKKKRTIEISDLAKLLKMGIVYIRDAAIKKVDFIYRMPPQAIIRDEVRDVPENLDDFYEANINKLGLLDESLIVKVKRFYERFKEWKKKHHEFYDYAHLSSISISKFGTLLVECKDLADLIIKKANELEIELDKKIKK